MKEVAEGGGSEGGEGKRKGHGRGNPVADIVGLRNEVCVVVGKRRIVDRSWESSSLCLFVGPKAWVGEGAG